LYLALHCNSSQQLVKTRRSKQGGLRLGCNLLATIATISAWLLICQPLSVTNVDLDFPSQFVFAKNWG